MKKQTVWRPILSGALCAVLVGPVWATTHDSYPGHGEDEYVPTSHSIILVNQSRLAEPTKYYDRLRIFIPPGALSVSMQLYTSVNSFPTVFAGYMAPPPSSSPVVDSKMLVDYLDGGRFVCSNIDGWDTIINDSFSALTPLQAGWLYVRVQGDWRRVETTIRVNSDVYGAWYESIDWAVDVEPGYNPSPLAGMDIAPPQGLRVYMRE